MADGIVIVSKRFGGRNGRAIGKSCPRVSLLGIYRRGPKEHDKNRSDYSAIHSRHGKKRTA
jgi:hypothetical protein